MPHFRITVHSSKAFDVSADADGFITIRVTAGENSVTLVMGEEEFVELCEMADQAVEDAASEDDI